MKEEIVRHLIQYGFFIPSAEIYGGFSGFYDFGPIGVRVKRKFVEFWRKFFVEEEGLFEIDGSLILPEQVFKASGHLESFTDPITECKKCGKVFRADKLIEEKMGIQADGLPKEELNKRLKEIKCPECGGELSDVEDVNLMFEIRVGYRKEARRAFLRPETAQSIFLDFYRVYKSFHPKFPFGIAQVGKAFRNEISPRKFVLRLREFYQMEIEWFVLRDPNCDPKERPFCKECKRCTMNNHPRFSEVRDVVIRIKDGENIFEKSVGEFVREGTIPNEHMGYWLAKIQKFMEKFIEREKFWFRKIPKEELPHYSVCNFDLEIETPFGIVEANGNAYRTDYDLRTHSKHSGTDLRFEYMGGKVYPNVIEPSFGVERPLFCIISNSYIPERDRKYPWLKLHPLIAPYTVSVHPLIETKEEFVEKAKEIHEMLRKNNIDSYFLVSKSIGKAYARMDSIGVPYNITIDYQTFEDNTVTIRFRDTREQVRIKVEELPKKIRELVERYPEFP